MEEEIGKSTKELTEMIEAFFEVLMDNGYYPMLYSYRSWLEQKLDMAILGKYAVWVAELGNSTSYQGGYYIWQFSHTGKCAGINGEVDIDYSYRDFPAILKKISANHL
jgi:GH25 family lysozyme M1 (1,4-beta-N-acetylmuramidase)